MAFGLCAFFTRRRELILSAAEGFPLPTAADIQTYPPLTVHDQEGILLI